METNELQHHGILGQRWGIRRYQNPDGTLTAAGRKRYDDDKTRGTYGKSKRAKKKVSEMSDEELKKAISRLNMEQQYKSLSSSSIKTGKNYVDKLIKIEKDIALLTGTGLAIYANAGKISNIIDKYR